MTTVQGRRRTYVRLFGSLWLALSVLYTLFALSEAFSAIIAFAGPPEHGSGRAAPPLFVVHAVSGGIALTAVAAQFRLAIPPGSSRRRLHRRLGMTYVVAAVATSVLSLGVTAGFHVGPLAKVFFLSEALLWLAATVLAYRHIRRGRAAEHRRWMIRSFALAAFFVSFSVWQPLMEAAPLPAPAGYAVAVLLAWSVNLLAAEIWIRTSSGRRGPEPARR